MPEITTPRLRPLTADDAPEIARLAGDWDIARMTALIPHPYSLADAKSFIASIDGGDIYAIERDGILVGCCGAQSASGTGNNASARVIRKLGVRPVGEKLTYDVARASQVRSLTYPDTHDAAAG